MPQVMAELLGAGASSPAGLLIAMGVVFVAAGTQGFLGFGFGITAMTGLALSFDVVHAAGVVNVTGLLVNLGVFYSLRGHIRWDSVRWIAPSLLVGVLAGVLALARVPSEGMVRLLGLTIVAIAGWNLVAPSLSRPRSRVVDVVVGGLSGLLGGAFNTGGPPLVAHLYSLPGPPERAKATIQTLFMLIGLSRLPIAASQGLMGRAIFVESALLAPLVLVGLWLGMRLGSRVPPERFRRIAWIALALLGGLLAAGA